MSYAAAITALLTSLRTIDGLNVLDGDPTAAHWTPLLWARFDNATRTTGGDRTTMRYRVSLQLAVDLQENTLAEVELRTWLNAIPAHIEQHVRDLGGLVAHCLVTGIFAVGEDGNPRIGDKLYRGARYELDIKEVKQAFVGLI